MANRALISLGEKGVVALSGVLSNGKEEAEFIVRNWQHWNKKIPPTKIKGYMIHKAARFGYLDTINLLLDRGADLCLRDEYGWTSLHMAAYYNQKNAVNFIINKGIDVDIQSYSGETPLHWAAEKGHADVVSILIDRGAFVNKKSDNGIIPLHLSAKNGHRDVVILLLKKGSNVNEKAEFSFRETPLHLAAEKGHLDVVSILIEWGAYVNAVDYLNNTPLDLATQGKQLETVLFLRNNNGKLQRELTTHHPHN